MNEVDQAVRWMLTEKADSVSEPERLLAGVHIRIRRRRNRRRALVSAVAVVVLLAAGTVAWSTDRQDRLVPAQRPSAGPGVVPPSPVGVGPMPTNFPAAQVMLDTPGNWLFTSQQDTRPDAWIQVRISRVRLVPSMGLGTYSTIPVGNLRADVYVVPPRPRGGIQERAGSNYKGGPYLELTYFHRAFGVWVQISASHRAETRPLGVTPDDLAGIARGITAQETPISDQLRFATAPPGLTVGGALTGPRRSIYEFLEPDGDYEAMRPEPGSLDLHGVVTVRVQAGHDHDNPIRVRTFEAGRWTVTKYRRLGTADGPSYLMTIDDRRSIIVEVDERARFTDEEMTHFIGGISLGPDFACCG
ncbi:hypothetical protein [Cryptosporangium arvum]|uniref:Uncharacterized protein n=1 Tax=Cryptosporangium arvum DSM 44712 TaxID=927661 RepID=A0A010ZX81_9ACTN|nr:hypothetical protein [Cryptosporangium arvum]EXG81827.1 hypothetical protein CryarDRAFT_2947 [Cryptosporangium arvum DSM 44712]